LQYIGNELELFSNAVNWKKYFSNKISPYIYGDVLEVGMGIGANTALLLNDKVTSWLGVEPDGTLLKVAQGKLIDKRCSFQQGTIDEKIIQTKKFDTILYIDVLEHIEKDDQELLKAFALLNKNGKLIVLSPAHQSLFSAFDKKIGHFRRYNKEMIIKISPPNLVLKKVFYLDSLGLFLSLGNKLLLKAEDPTIGQIKFWDSMIVPMSKISDWMSFFSFGKSIVAVWSND
jgi:2-polyprenyl-3-methyl-5-hydroxy-6-metoxy-1,4-benzoquinol methylase